MNQFLEDISDSWQQSPWNWEKHYKRLFKAVKRYSDEELISTMQLLRDRRSKIYRLDTWIAAHLFTEGLMSNDGFLDLTDCIIVTPHYDEVEETADALIHHPEFEGYTEMYFANIPAHIYDKRKRAPKYTFLIMEHISHEPGPKFPCFDREVATKLVPKLTSKFGNLVTWKS